MYRRVLHRMFCLYKWKWVRMRRSSSCEIHVNTSLKIIRRYIAYSVRDEREVVLSGMPVTEQAFVSELYSAARSDPPSNGDSASSFSSLTKQLSQLDTFTVPAEPEHVSLLDAAKRGVSFTHRKLLVRLDQLGVMLDRRHCCRSGRHLLSIRGCSCRAVVPRWPRLEHRRSLCNCKAGRSSFS